MSVECATRFCLSRNRAHQFHPRYAVEFQQLGDVRRACITDLVAALRNSVGSSSRLQVFARQNEPNTTPHVRLPWCSLASNHDMRWQCAQPRFETGCYPTVQSTSPNNYSKQIAREHARCSLGVVTKLIQPTFVNLPF